MDHQKSSPSRWGAVAATGALLGGLLLLNGAAIREIIEARKEARDLAQHELELRLEERAQAFQAHLANLRSDLVALAETAPLRGLAGRLISSDPQVRRWARLDAEGSLVLFVQSRPAMQHLWLSIDEGLDPVVIGRRRNVAVILDPVGATPPEDPALVATKVMLAVGADAWIRGWIDPERILSGETGLGIESLSLEPSPPSTVEDGEIVAAAEVEDLRWEPPVHAWLVARQDATQAERSIAFLAGRYRRTVLWNLVVVVAASAAVALALAQVRRRVRAEAIAEHERTVRELERELIHSERLASVGRFAAGVAHEVNNPLEGMSNYLKLLESDLELGNTTSAQERIHRVREGLDRAAGVVRRVLTFSDPAHSPKELLSVLEPVQEAIEFLRPRFPEVDIRLVADGETTSVRGNRVALGQLFLNLLLNACEGQSEGGRVEVRVSDYNSTVVVTIRDQGPGLSDEAFAHLFEPFYSTRGSRGLGLSVCHGIVQDHGGEILGSNAVDGLGAIFEVRLPAIPPSEESAES